MLNEFTGLAGQSNEVADGILATQEGGRGTVLALRVHFERSKKWTKMRRGRWLIQRRIHEDAWTSDTFYTLSYKPLIGFYTALIRFGLTESLYLVKPSSWRGHEEQSWAQSVSLSSFTHHKRKETFPLTKEIKGSRRLSACLPCRRKWLLPELLD